MHLKFSLVSSFKPPTHTYMYVVSSTIIEVIYDYIQSIATCRGLLLFSGPLPSEIYNISVIQHFCPGLVNLQITLAQGVLIEERTKRTYLKV